jgi:hypothetical protein
LGAAQFRVAGNSANLTHPTIGIDLDGFVDNARARIPGEGSGNRESRRSGLDLSGEIRTLPVCPANVDP